MVGGPASDHGARRKTPSLPPPAPTSHSGPPRAAAARQTPRLPEAASRGSARPRRTRRLGQSPTASEPRLCVTERAAPPSGTGARRRLMRVWGAEPGAPPPPSRPGTAEKAAQVGLHVHSRARGPRAVLAQPGTGAALEARRVAPGCVCWAVASRKPRAVSPVVRGQGACGQGLASTVSQVEPHTES